VDLVLRSCLGLGLAWTVGLGCKRDRDRSASDDEAQAEDEAHRFEAGAPAVVVAPEVPWTVELVDAGAEPRRQLGFATRAPARELLLSTGLLRREKGEQEDPMIVARLELAWRGVEPEGERRRYLFEITGVRQGPDAWPATEQDSFEARVESSIEKMFLSVRGQAEGTARGIEQLSRTRGMKSLQPEPAALLELFAVPLPAEAVGVGARWAASHRHDASAPKGPGMRTLLKPGREQEWVTTERSYRVRALEGDRLELELEGHRAVDGVERTRWQGELELDLADPLARRGHIELTELLERPPQWQGEWPKEMREVTSVVELE
jgi:hypothetical protein